MTDVLPHIAAITVPHGVGRSEWRDHLIARLQDQGSRDVLESDDRLREDAGRYSLLEVEQAVEVYGQAPWFTLDVRCPFGGSIAGFLCWEWWLSSYDQRDFFASNVLFAGLGYLARRDGDIRIDALVEETFPLVDAARNAGFHDGEFFLQGHPGYDAYVRELIERQVGAAGLTPLMFTGGTGHNPHRFEQFEPRRDQTFASCWELFDAHEQDPITLWGRNITGLRSRAYCELVEAD